ncbi:hypothetical protein AVEN_209938-1 [Araneus ventricosus]|uniref:Uncharacterized protein n=1 Tax=Araneus ventricosus TaxID=182803 RepID=A0A4Y2DDV1_ARAVE|nr:hypothetical protein AVEN_209938-1 [Araneus ventricosus]
MQEGCFGIHLAPLSQRLDEKSDIYGVNIFPDFSARTDGGAFDSEGFRPPYMSRFRSNRLSGPIQGGSSVESGFEPGALRPQSRDPTTRPPRTPICLQIQEQRIICDNTSFTARLKKRT